MPGHRDAALADRLGSLLASVGLEGRVEGLHRLSGGASRETWALDLVGPSAARPLILQRLRPGTVGAGPGMSGEAALIRAAGAARVSAVAPRDARGFAGGVSAAGAHWRAWPGLTS